METKKLQNTNFEAELSSALKSAGYIFPTTDKEAEYFLEQSEDIDVPDKYKTCNFIFDESDRALDIIKGTHVDNQKAKQNWAIAARHGRNIPQDILDKMKHDKDNSPKK